MRQQVNYYALPFLVLLLGLAFIFQSEAQETTSTPATSDSSSGQPMIDGIEELVAPGAPVVAKEFQADQDKNIDPLNKKPFPISFKGNAGIKQWYFPQDGSIPADPNHVSSLFGSAEVTWRASNHLEVRAAPRFVLDFDNGDRTRPFIIDDLYINWLTENIGLKAGYQIFSWKMTETYSPADFLNQVDREVDFLDAEKLGVPAAQIRWILPGKYDHSLELYYLPYFQPSPLPQPGNRYAFGSITNQYVYLGEWSEWHPQGAVRYITSLVPDFDITGFYFYGYERMNGVTKKNNVPVHEYRRLHKAGLTFQGSVDAWLVKGELVYNHAIDPISKITFDSLSHPISNNLFVVSPYAAYNMGLEYSWYSALIQNQDIGWILELMGDTDAGKIADDLGGFRPLQSHVFIGARYTFNNISDRAILAGCFLDYRRGDVIYSVEYEERLFTHVHIKFGFSGLQANLLPAPDDGEPSPLKNFEKNVRLDGVLKLSF